jgi:hypothetical protein
MKAPFQNLAKDTYGGFEDGRDYIQHAVPASGSANLVPGQNSVVVSTLYQGKANENIEQPDLVDLPWFTWSCTVQWFLIEFI